MIIWNSRLILFYNHENIISVYCKRKKGRKEEMKVRKEGGRKGESRGVREGEGRFVE